MQITLAIRYDGLDAVDHQLDMRLFGRALIGMDRALSYGLTALATGHLPGPHEKLPLTVKASAPQAACVEFGAIITTAPLLLPFVIQVFDKKGVDIAWLLISAALKRLGGKSKAADQNIGEIMETMNKLIDDRQLERQHVIDIIDRLRPSAANIVAPIGPSSEFLRIEGAGGRQTEIDVPMAQAVRSKDPLEVGDMVQIRVKVDGVIMHNRTLKVELADQPGRYLSAEVRDPAFDTTPNVYTQALNSFLTVDAKPTYRDGELVKLHIMNATPDRRAA